MAEKQNPRRGDMESTPQRGLHREISQRALQMSYSFPSKVCVGSFIGGICFAYIFHFFLPSFRTMEYGLTFTTPSVEMVHTSSLADISKSGDCDFTLKDMGTEEDLQRSFIDDERVSLLYSAWSDMLNVSEEGDGDDFLSSVGLNRSSVPKAPHMENCELSTRVNQRLDSHGENGSFPPWTIWKGLLGLELLRPTSEMDKEQKRFERLAKSEGAYPPWIVGSDEDNYPLTRKVQHDIWVHQHPLNCSDSQVRFLVADWERLPGLGIGAQFAGMCGLLAIAIKEKRVLVTNYYNRADHDGCQGPARSHWSCYFFPETSIECRDRALELVMRQEAWETGTVTGKDNYTSKEIWAGRVPRVWGNPWDHLQPTTDIDGSLVIHHRKMDRRWWRAQAIRYLMRFRSEYTCNLLNIARHEAFGSQAAKVVLGSLITDWQEAVVNNSRAGIEQFVWSNHEPWIPRPILSMHVRMGDKASEMKVVGFEEYMRLAERIRKRFPNLNNIWLSTEMQEVIDKSRLYTHWNFYYTNVTRQVGNIAMAVYEASLSRETSTNYPLVNFLMATEADFFIGALGSTWCFLIDSMRNTGGKVMAGYLSVNKDRFW